MRSKVEKLVQDQEGYHIVTCNVNEDEEIKSSLEEVSVNNRTDHFRVETSLNQASHAFDSKKKGTLDMIVHSVAHAPREALASVKQTSRKDFLSTFETSVYG